MGIYRAVHRYKKKFERKFTRQNTRKQLNFMCDRNIIYGVKIITRDLEIPLYPLLEHCIQLGCSEILVLMKDDALREQLCRHLLRDHLLVKVTVPASEPVAHRTMRLQNALRYIELMERTRTPQEIKDVLIGLWGKLENESPE